MKLPSSDARSTYTGASSRGCAGRPTGVSDGETAVFSGGGELGSMGVQTGPGATAFTRMPSGASIALRALVKVRMAPLVVAYASRFGDGWYACTEVVLMI